jgi:YbbR domain-containing protein
MTNMMAFLSRQLESWTFRPSKTQWLRFGISLALAILLWGWVTQLQDPYITRTIANVNVELGQLPESMQVVSTLDDVVVTLKGAESRLAGIRASDVSVQIDTSGITEPGSYRVPLIVDAPNVNNRSVEPGEVLIQVDERVSEIFPVEVSSSDPADQTRAVTNVVPAVTQVTVTGPKTAVDRVAKVILPVTIDRQTQSYDAAYAPQAVDESGQTIAEVEILPESISTHVELQTRGKSVSVITVVTGDPADGYSIQQRRAIPDTIVVEGSADVLDDLLFVNTDPVDVTGATQSVSTRVGLADLPPGVTILEPTSGTVEVRVAIQDTSATSQTLTGLPIETVGMEDGLTASFDADEVSIQVSAPVEVLQAMTQDDIGILVDLAGYGPGTYRVTPSVTVPQGVTWLGSNPDTILVTIRSEDSATPGSSTPVASPAPG